MYDMERGMGCDAAVPHHIRVCLPAMHGVAGAELAAVLSAAAKGDGRAGGSSYGGSSYGGGSGSSSSSSTRMSGEQYKRRSLELLRVALAYGQQECVLQGPQ